MEVIEHSESVMSKIPGLLYVNMRESFNDEILHAPTRARQRVKSQWVAREGYFGVPA